MIYLFSIIMKLVQYNKRNKETKFSEAMLLFFFFFLMNEQKFVTVFFFFIKLSILRVVLLTQHFHKKFTTKSRWQVVKGK